MDTLGRHGLKAILGTPTATPPRWLIDKMPDMLAVDANGRSRGFGSRRHYDFSHLGYRNEAARITDLLASRFGHHPALGGWQTDNEYGCHDTTYSYSESARRGFRYWLRQNFLYPRDIPIVIKEVPCGKPGCPPIETAIIAVLRGEPPQVFKVQRPIDEVTFDHIYDLMENPMPCC